MTKDYSYFYQKLYQGKGADKTPAIKNLLKPSHWTHRETCGKPWKPGKLVGNLFVKSRELPGKYCTGTGTRRKPGKLWNLKKTIKKPLIKI